jgi:riboflavin synthase
MFTGLVQAKGRIAQVTPLGSSGAAGVRIIVDALGLVPRTIAVGDSIAVNGVCLTATRVEGMQFHADVSQETLARTTGLDRCDAVNLEAALALGDVLGGHLLAGHVDGVGTVVRLTPVGESVEMVLRAPRSLAPYLAPKGSVAVDGVSLTINRVQDLDAGADRACEISINLIPHTLDATNLRARDAGARVNLEADLIARYVVRALEARSSG